MGQLGATDEEIALRIELNAIEARESRAFLLDWALVVDRLAQWEARPMDFRPCRLVGSIADGTNTSQGFTLTEVAMVERLCARLRRALGEPDLPDLDETPQVREHLERKAETVKARRKRARTRQKDKRTDATKQRDRIRNRCIRGLASPDEFRAIGREPPADFEAEMKRRREKSYARHRAAYAKRQASKCQCQDPSCPHCHPAGSNGCAH